MRAALAGLMFWALAMPAIAAPPPVDTATHGASVDIRSKNSQPPTYPPEAVHAGITGTVELQVDVTAAGGVANIVIRTSSGSPALDTAAMQAAQRWTYAPGRQEGQPVAGTVQIPVTFKL